MTAYHDLDRPHEMRSDAARLEAWTPALGPGVRYEEFPHDQPKPVIEIDGAAAALAGAFDRG